MGGRLPRGSARAKHLASSGHGPDSKDFITEPCSAKIWEAFFGPSAISRSCPYCSALWKGTRFGGRSVRSLAWPFQISTAVPREKSMSSGMSAGNFHSMRGRSHSGSNKIVNLFGRDLCHKRSPGKRRSIPACSQLSDVIWLLQPKLPCHLVSCLSRPRRHNWGPTDWFMQVKVETHREGS
jgi:hypothetical protein